MSNVLIIASHPDDGVLGCGRTAVRLAEEGEKVHILILGEGITSRSSAIESDRECEIRFLHTCARQAGEIIGAASVRVLDFPDNRFDTVALLGIVKKIEEAIDEIRPETVFTQHGGDLNVDHAQTYRAVLTATRPMKGTSVRRVLASEVASEVASSTEWAFQQFEPIFKSNTFVDISESLDANITAMQTYDSEARDFPHPRSPEALRAAAKRWSSVAGLEAAEAFELVRDIR